MRWCGSLAVAASMLASSSAAFAGHWVLKSDGFGDAPIYGVDKDTSPGDVMKIAKQKLDPNQTSGGKVVWVEDDGPVLTCVEVAAVADEKGGALDRLWKLLGGIKDAIKKVCSPDTQIDGSQKKAQKQGAPVGIVLVLPNGAKQRIPLASLEKMPAADAAALFEIKPSSGGCPGCAGGPMLVVVGVDKVASVGFLDASAKATVKPVTRVGSNALVYGEMYAGGLSWSKGVQVSTEDKKSIVLKPLAPKAQK